MASRRLARGKVAHAPRACRQQPLPGDEPPSALEPERKQRVAELMAQPGFRRADDDVDWLQRDQLRGVRLLLEYEKPQLALAEHRIVSTVVLFGGTRIVEPERAARRVSLCRAALAADPDNPLRARELAIALRVAEKSHYYEVARDLARKLASFETENGPPRAGDLEWVVTTGGGPGIMEAGNRGAREVGRPSIGLNITLPREQFPNPYISDELCFQFRYFAIRKLHFLLRAKALVAFPGGYGTLDELFDALCLIQTRKITPMPVILVGRDFWERALDLPFLVEEGVIDEEDLHIVQYAETADEVLDVIRHFPRE